MYFLHLFLALISWREGHLVLCTHLIKGRMFTLRTVSQASADAVGEVLYIQGVPKKMYTYCKRCYLCITFWSWIELRQQRVVGRSLKRWCKSNECRRWEFARTMDRTKRCGRISTHVLLTKHPLTSTYGVEKGRVWGLFGTAACRPIVPLPPVSSPHSSPEAPRTT